MKSRTKLEEELANVLSEALRTAIASKGTASLLVSGGSTPLELFKRLSAVDLDWEKVSISLVDERFLPDDHPDQNGAMVKATLLQNKAAKATFIPLVLDANDAQNNLAQAREAVQAIPRPFTAVVLGMGTDGHTASLFPDAQELDRGMDLNTEEELIIPAQQKAPHERITFTRRALLTTEHLLLHCYGAEKKSVLEAARYNTTYRPYPIEAFLHQDEAALQVYWTA